MIARLGSWRCRIASEQRSEKVPPRYVAESMLAVVENRQARNALLEHPIGCFTDVVSLIEQSPRVINW